MDLQIKENMIVDTLPTVASQNTDASDQNAHLQLHLKMQNARSQPWKGQTDSRRCNVNRSHKTNQNAAMSKCIDATMLRINTKTVSQIRRPVTTAETTTNELRCLL